MGILLITRGLGVGRGDCPRVPGEIDTETRGPTVDCGFHRPPIVEPWSNWAIV